MVRDTKFIKVRLRSRGSIDNVYDIYIIRIWVAASYPLITLTVLLPARAAQRNKFISRIVKALVPDERAPGRGMPEDEEFRGGHGR